MVHARPIHHGDETRVLEMYVLMSSQWSILGDDHFGFSVRRQRASVCVVSVGLRRQLVASHFRRV